MKSILVALVLIGCFVGYSESVPAVGSLGGICNYYSAALGVNNSFLISTVVTQVFGLTLADPNLVIFFNGSKVNSLNGFSFTANLTAYNTLFTRLVQFFAQAAVLNCTDGSIGAYSGRQLIPVHQGLAINYQVFAQFNQYILTVLTNNMVNVTDVIIVAKVLNTLSGSACFAADCTSICNKYSVQGVMNNNALVTAIVIGTFFAAINTSLINFFNTSVQYTGAVNYLTNVTAQGILVDHLVRFFGGALGCSDGSIGAYAGSLPATHSFLLINTAQFNQFNTILVGVMAAFGVSVADQATVLAVLQSTKASICYAADCFPTTAATSTSVPPVATSKSAAGLLTPTIAAFAGAFATYRLL